jgi:hypothetical protein
MRTRLILLVATVALLAACGAESGPSGRTSASTTPPTAGVTTTLPPAPITSATTITATTTTTSTTSTTVAPEPELPLVLHPDGLGVVSFGESVDDAMEVLTDLLGPPDWDEIQQSAEIDRAVQWYGVGLYVQFTTWDHFDVTPPHPVADGPVFHYYLTESDQLATAESIGVGSTLAELEAAYPNVRYEKPCDDQWSFAVDDPSGWIGYRLFGLFDGELNDPATRIVHVGAGLDRTPC